MPGAKFSDLLEDIQKEREKSEVLLELGRFNDQNSQANDRVMRANSRTMRLAFLVALIGILIATAPQIASLEETVPVAATPAS